jgi:hypothetical protein
MIIPAFKQAIDYKHSYLSAKKLGKKSKPAEIFYAKRKEWRFFKKYNSYLV